MSCPRFSRRRTLQGGLAASLLGLGCRPRPTSTPAPASNDKLGGPADLFVRGGRIETLDPGQPTADAVAIMDGEILAVGDEASVAMFVGPTTRTVDLRGGLAVPGLVDAHAHVTGLGMSLEQIDLRGATSIEEVVARLKAGDRGQSWLVGRGWDQNLWPDKAMPTHAPLSQAFPDRPVWLRRVDGHAGWANAAAMKAAGIGPSTKAPSGGEIPRDRKGHPTGVLVDAAMGLMTPPAPTREELRRYILAAQDKMVSVGLVGAHDMGIGPTEDEVYGELGFAEDPAMRLRIRVHAYAAQSWFATFDPGMPRAPRWAVERYVLGGVKLYADGALGSRGAALLADYADRPGHRGLLQNTPEDLLAMCDKAARESWQVATHAIGDAGNRTVLDQYATALQHAGRDPRWRIEHAQIVDPADIPRFAKLGVIASMQPTHATSDMPWVPDRLGPDRLDGAYAWRRFLDAGVRLALGSDFPVELPDVTHGLYAAITRQDAAGDPPGGWRPDQRLTLREAIAGFSTGAAHAAHAEDHRGRLAVGQRGDLSCFDRDLFEVEPAEVREAKVIATIIDGEVLYEA